MGIIIAIVVIGVAAWLIDGRSPQAIIVSHAFPQITLEDYAQQRGDMTDKSTEEIPSDVNFPREMRQYRIGNMQVFHMEPQDASKPIVLYIHGGAYVHNFAALGCNGRMGHDNRLWYRDSQLSAAVLLHC